MRQTTQNLTDERYARCFLEQTQYQTPTEDQKAVLGEVAAFVGAMGAEHSLGRCGRYWLTLSGAPGCGKTMLAKEVFRFAERHFEYPGPGELRELRFRHINRMVEEWREGVGRNEFDEGAWLLVVDDFGAHYSTDYAESKLYDLLNRRIGRWTMITTNLAFKTIRDKEERVASRLVRGGNRWVASKSGDWDAEHYE